jgi:hypothetical protein
LSVYLVTSLVALHYEDYEGNNSTFRLKRLHVPYITLSFIKTKLTK